jgi:hypothetical protein
MFSVVPFYLFANNHYYTQNILFLTWNVYFDVQFIVSVPNLVFYFLLYVLGYYINLEWKWLFFTSSCVIFVFISWKLACSGRGTPHT